MESAAATLADRDLAERCSRGDGAAWETLYRRFHPLLLAYIRARLGPANAYRADVEDLAASVWCEIILQRTRLLGNYDPGRGCRLTTFLLCLARQQVRLFRKTSRRHRIEAPGRAGRPPRDWTGPVRDALDRSAEDAVAGLDLADFFATLTPRELLYCRERLLGLQGDSDATPFSAANSWQLRHRIMRKLERFLGSH